MNTVTETLNPIRNPSLFTLTEQTRMALAQIEEDPVTGKLIGVEQFDAIAFSTQEKLIDCACAISNFQNLIDQIEEQERQLARRKKFVQRIVDHVKERCVDAMETLQIKSIKAAPVQISLRKASSVVIFDENQLPKKFFTFPKVKPRVDKVAIGAAIKGGEEVAGARIDSYNTLQVK